jgi:hypothetical protein
VVKVELPLLSPASEDIALPDEEPEMDSVEKEEELDDTNRYRYHTPWCRQCCGFGNRCLFFDPWILEPGLVKIRIRRKRRERRAG